MYNKRRKYNVISLFSGAMGLDLGLEKAGFKIKVCVDNDKDCCDTIRLNTDIPILQKDISEVSGDDILRASGIKKGKVFLVAGGPPCQSFSTAGRRRSLGDFRGNVIINFLRLVKELNPKFFIMENVRGLLSSKLNVIPKECDGDYQKVAHLVGSVLYFLVQEFKKAGYAVSFTLFDSANYGVPQKRERLLIFGHLGRTGVPLPQPTHTETGTETGKKHVNLKKALEGLRNSNVHYIDFSPRLKKYLKLLKAGQNWRDLPTSQKKEAMGKSYNLGGGKTGFYRRLSWGLPSPTLVTRPNMPATLLCHPSRIRPLGIEEYARIQQFPYNWKFAGSMISIYRQIGNAVPVGFGYVAGCAVRDFYERRKPRGNNGLRYSRYLNATDKEFDAEFRQRVLAPF